MSTQVPQYLNRTWLALAAVVAFALGPLPAANADNIYAFETLSATYDGQPTSMFSGFGEIVVSAGSVASGHAAVTTSDPTRGTPVETLFGITSADFGFSIGPAIGSPNGAIDFTANLSGRNITIDPENLYGGFFVNGDDSEAYYATSDGGNLLTIGYGTDNAGSPCWGPQSPSSSRCVVTGEFVYAGDPPGAAPPRVDPLPEPATLPIFLTGLCALLLLRRHRQPAL